MKTTAELEQEKKALQMQHEQGLLSQEEREKFAKDLEFMTSFQSDSSYNNNVDPKTMTKMLGLIEASIGNMRYNTFLLEQLEQDEENPVLQTALAFTYRTRGYTHQKMQKIFALNPEKDDKISLEEIGMLYDFSELKKNDALRMLSICNGDKKDGKLFDLIQDIKQADKIFKEYENKFSHIINNIEIKSGDIFFDSLEKIEEIRRGFRGSGKSWQKKLTNYEHIGQFFKDQNNALWQSEMHLYTRVASRIYDNSQFSLKDALQLELYRIDIPQLLNRDILQILEKKDPQWKKNIQERFEKITNALQILPRLNYIRYNERNELMSGFESGKSSIQQREKDRDFKKVHDKMFGAEVEGKNYSNDIFFTSYHGLDNERRKEEQKKFEKMLSDPIDEVLNEKNFPNIKQEELAIIKKGFEEYRENIETRKNTGMTCSELIVKSLIASLYRLDMELKQEFGDDLSESDKKQQWVNIPIPPKAKLATMTPEQLHRSLMQHNCLQKIDIVPFIKEREKGIQKD